MAEVIYIITLSFGQFGGYQCYNIVVVVVLLLLLWRFWVIRGCRAAPESRHGGAGPWPLCRCGAPWFYSLSLLLCPA